MAESSVIREFLVSLGFRLDEPALKKFEDAIDKGTKSVTRLATAVTATAVAVSVGVTKIASNLEALYFASIKTGSAATNLHAFDRAMQNLGTEAGEALSSVEGLARALRENPGNEGLLESLGVKTRNANGELRDTTELMVDLARSFRDMPYYLASQRAGMLGISEDTLRAMRSEGFEREFRRMQERMRNIGFDQATKDAHRFMMELRDLIVQLEAFGVRVYDALSKRLGGGVGKLTEWLQQHGPMLAERVAEILLKLLDLAQRLAPAFIWIVDKLIEWDKATGGWSTRLLGLLAVLKFFGGASLIGGIVSLTAAFMKLGAGIAGASAGGAGLMALLGRLGLLGALAYGGYELYKATSIKPGERGTGKATPWAQRIEDWMQSVLPKRSTAMFELEKSGLTHAQAAGVVANLEAESRLNPQAVGDSGKAFGIAQWHPDRQELFKRWAGIDIRHSTFGQQLGFLVHELQTNERAAYNMLRNAKTAQEAGAVFARYYERPAALDFEAARRGLAAVEISQQTDVHVHGVSDPEEAARRAAAEQARVNAALVRNFQVAVQ